MDAGAAIGSRPPVSCNRMAVPALYAPRRVAAPGLRRRGGGVGKTMRRHPVTPRTAAGLHLAPFILAARVTP